MTLPPPDSASTIKHHPRKALRYKRPNALIPKQKIENTMTRTFLKDSNKKVSLVRNRVVYRLQKNPRRLNNHPNSPSNT